MHQPNHHGNVFSQMVASKQTIRGTNATKHKWPQRLTSTSPRKAPSMAKPRSRQANMDIKYRSKQAYTYIKKMTQTFDIGLGLGLDHKI